MRVVSLALAAILAGMAVPALAAPDPYGLLAMITGGLSDGGQVNLGPLGVGKVSRTGPKAYLVNVPAGQVGFVFAQPQPCVFTQTSQPPKQPPFTVQFDMGLVTAISFIDQGKSNGLNMVALHFEGGGAIVQVIADDGTAQIAQPAASIVTSLSVDQLNKAAAALHALCPQR